MRVHVGFISAEASWSLFVLLLRDDLQRHLHLSLKQRQQTGLYGPVPSGRGAVKFTRTSSQNSIFVSRVLPLSCSWKLFLFCFFKSWIQTEEAELNSINQNESSLFSVF